MSLSLNAEQKNIQKIGPVMLRSLDILQLNTVDLRDLVIKEVNNNPAVEFVEPDKTSFEGDKKEFYLESLKDKKSIEDYLLEQVPDWSERKKDILLKIVYVLDEDGFFHDDLKKIADQLKVPVEEVLSVQEELKNLKPYGLSSRNRQEALVVQAQNILAGSRDLPKVIDVIEKHLNDILTGFFKKVAKNENLSLRQVERIGRFILRLNFSPLSFFHSEYVAPVIPDARIFKREIEWVVEINEYYFPRLRFSKMYKDIYSVAGNDSAKDFLINCAKRARVLSSAIEKRNETLRSVLYSILGHQKQFFEFGPKWTRGLSLKMVANELNVNVSTVSRAVANKYVDTPFGVKKISTFFESSVRGYSSTFIKTEMKKLLKHADHYLSDQEIADTLHDRGVSVARRTITKYRHEENLPNSRIRKIT